MNCVNWQFCFEKENTCFCVALESTLDCLTRDINRRSCIYNSTVGPHTVSAGCCSLDFEAHISVCRVAKFQICSDDICERACIREKGEKAGGIQSICQGVQTVFHPAYSERYIYHYHADAGELLCLDHCRRI